MPPRRLEDKLDGGGVEEINFTEVKVEVVKSSTVAEGGEDLDKPPVTQAYLFSASEHEQGVPPEE